LFDYVQSVVALQVDCEKIRWFSDAYISQREWFFSMFVIGDYYDLFYLSYLLSLDGVIAMNFQGLWCFYFNVVFEALNLWFNVSFVVV
jgi:hypothetical protein